MPSAARIIDANANRAREAMRVMEDAARFTLDDRRLSGQLKQLRHDFAAALRGLGDLSRHRDTPGDVGTSLTTETERARGSVAEIVTAAGKRLGEALRCCEEYGKLIDVDFAAAVKQLRYRAYTIEQQLADRLQPVAVRQWRLCVLITESLCEHHDWLDVAQASIDGGADCLQLREKNLDAGELLDRAGRLVELAESAGATIIVNDRPDIALAAGCHGVHVGQHDLPIDAVRKIARRQLLVGTSTHNMTEARRAVRDGVDYCGVGAMFATTTKQRRPAGLKYLQKFVERYPEMPHLAIGGINASNVQQVIDAGARGVAVSSAVCAAKAPKRVVRGLIRKLNASSRSND